MEKVILTFVHHLQQGGMKISISEISDALKALQRWGIEDERKFHRILKATLLKNQSDNSLFELAYDIYFQRQPLPLKINNETASCCTDQSIPLKGTAGMSSKAQSFYGALLNNDGTKIMAEIDAALAETPVNELNLEELLHQCKVTLSWFMVVNAVEQQQNQKAQCTLGQLETYMRRSLATKISKEDDGGFSSLLNQENICEKDFNALSSEQVKAMEIRIAKLGKQLGARYSYSLKPGKTGIINMRKVLAETAKRGYLSGQVTYLNKVRNKPSLVVLCDISGSMAQHSSFFLQLVYAMKKRFQDIHSFLFIDNIVEAKFPPQAATPGAAIAAAVTAAYVPRTGRTGQHCTTTGVSDYGKVFHNFLNKFSNVLSPKTSVIILGDAKNNWFPSGKDELQTIKNLSKSIIWLNPQPQPSWNTEDSVIKEYAPYCQALHECSNLRQLTKIANKII